MAIRHSISSDARHPFKLHTCRPQNEMVQPFVDRAPACNPGADTAANGRQFAAEPDWLDQLGFVIPGTL
jgi:hypothetical protein